MHLKSPQQHKSTHIWENGPDQSEKKNRLTQANNCAGQQKCPSRLLWLARDLINRDNASFTKLLASVKNMPCFQEAWKVPRNQGKNLN